MLRPWRVRDADGTAHTFATRAKANAYKERHAGSRITARPLKLGRGQQDTTRVVAKVYQQELKREGEKVSLREIAGKRELRKKVKDFKIQSAKGVPKRFVSVSPLWDEIDWDLFREYYHET